MFTTILSLGIILIQVAIVLFIVLWLKNNTALNKFKNYSHIILSVIFISSALASLIYEFVFGYEPCLLCWYQRIFIFGIAILSLTSDIRTNKLLQKQVIIFSTLGLLVAILHNYIDLVPTGVDLCGAGPSCLKRYIYEFGYITIPMMSFTALLSGTLLSLFLFRSKDTTVALK